ncbi:MAG: 30S ribosomal protein S16 [Candidatus Zixiibacteriota bacterium]
MAVHIRLRRMGAKKRPFYRIVAADSRRARDGRFLENLGTYNPVTKPAVITVVEDKLTKWLDQGAVPSDTVKTLLTQIGYIEKYHKGKKGEDVSEITLKQHITERKKKTRKAKKAAVVAEASRAGETTDGATQTEKKEETASE